MRNFKMALIAPILGVMALTGCQTTQGTQKFYPDGKLEDLLLNLTDNKLTSEKLVPILEADLKQSSVENYEILEVLSDYFETNNDQEASFRFNRKKALHTDGDKRDYVKLACHYWTGQGTLADKNMAEEWLEKAAYQGSLEARFFLSEIYLKGLNGSKNIEQGTYWKTRALAATQRARHRRYNSPVPPIEFETNQQLRYTECDPILEKIGEEYYKIGLQKTDDNAHTLFENFETKVQMPKAKTKDNLDLLFRAASLGHPSAHRKLARFFKRKETPDYSLDKAIEWYQKYAILDPYKFYDGDDLACLLWEKNKRAESVFWYAHAADKYPHKDDIEHFSTYLNQLNANERREFDLMYENWAYNGKLP